MFTFGLMTQEAKVKYPSANLNDSAWTNGQYDFVSDVNESISPIQTAFTEITDEDKGWFSVVTSGIAAIPWAVVNLPILLFKSFAWGGSILTTMLTTLAVPAYMISAVLVILIVWGVFKLIELFHRWQI